MSFCISSIISNYCPPSLIGAANMKISVMISSTR